MRPGTIKHMVLMCLALLWAAPWILIGIALCFTLVGIFAFPLFMAIGSWPANNLVKKRAREVIKMKKTQQWHQVAPTKYTGQRWD